MRDKPSRDKPTVSGAAVGSAGRRPAHASSASNVSSVSSDMRLCAFDWSSTRSRDVVDGLPPLHAHEYTSLAAQLVQYSSQRGLQLGTTLARGLDHHRVAPAAKFACDRHPSNAVHHRRSPFAVGEVY